MASLGFTREQVGSLYADQLHKGLLARLARIEGQLKGVAKMVEGQRPCLEVLQQLASIQAALKGVTKSVLRNHVERCATDAMAWPCCRGSPDPARSPPTRASSVRWGWRS